jgi:hypothetical protein
MYRYRYRCTLPIYYVLHYNCIHILYKVHVAPAEMLCLDAWFYHLATYTIRQNAIVCKTNTYSRVRNCLLNYLQKPRFYESIERKTEIRTLTVSAEKGYRVHKLFQFAYLLYRAERYCFIVFSVFNSSAIKYLVCSL